MLIPLKVVESHSSIRQDHGLDVSVSDITSNMSVTSISFQTSMVSRQPQPKRIFIGAGVESFIGNIENIGCDVWPKIIIAARNRFKQK